MKSELLEILRCPNCFSELDLIPAREDETEVRTGHLNCLKNCTHSFQIEDGIVHLGTGFDHAAVQRERDYENSTYTGSDRLRDARLIAQFPDTLAELWPHTCHFGPDFQALIDHLDPRPGEWVLDVGTGPCWSCRLLAQRGCKVIALDVNEADFYGLRTADILFATHNVFFERILESMTRMPFRSGSLHHITFNASFHHTPEMEKTLQECFRVLRPGGKVAMVNEEFTSLRHSIAGALLPRPVATDTGSHHSIRYGEFEDAVGKFGFSLEYRVAEHVRQTLERRFSRRIGKAISRSLERIPFALKQLNSALVLLEKPGTSRRVVVTEETANHRR